MNRHVKAAVARGFLPSASPEREARDYWLGMDEHQRFRSTRAGVTTEAQFVEACMEEMRTQRSDRAKDYYGHLSSGASL